MKFQELKNRFQKKYVFRMVAGVLSLAVVAGSVAVYHTTAPKADEKVQQEQSTLDYKELFGDFTFSENEVEKEESVYIISDATGKAVKTIVSDKLTNKNGESSLRDVSDLKDIINVKGDESFEANGTSLTWQANGNSISYQGTTEKTLPVEQKVTYFLDGKVISPEELAGKSGEVKIRFDFTNNTNYAVNVDGKGYKVKVPFAAISAVVLNDQFTNVEVTNAKIKDSDQSTLVLGYAMPGMTETLGMEEGKVPEFFEIKADVKDFKLDVAMTLVVNATNYASVDGLDFTGLSDLVSNLEDASNQLETGSKDLSDGLTTLKGSLVEFVEGMQTLNNSKDALAGGVLQLQGSANTLNQATTTLKKALEATLSEKEKNTYKAMAVEGVDKKFEAGTFEATQNMIYQGLRYNADGTDSQLYLTLYNGAVMSAVQKLPVAQIAAAGSMDTVVNMIITQAGSTIQQTVEASLQMVAANMAQACQTAAQQAAGEALLQGIDAAKASILSQITATQDNGYSFVTGMQALSDGTDTLANSVPALTEGITKLTDASLLIQDGVNKLDDGANQLEAGILQFNEQAIDKLVSAYHGDVKDLADRFEAVLEAGEQYQIFTDKAEEMQGSVTFIYKLGSVE